MIRYSFITILLLLASFVLQQFLPAFTGSDAAMPCLNPAQIAYSGHSAQAGFFGVQIVAPRSISACATQPGRSAPAKACALSRSSGLDPGKGA